MKKNFSLTEANKKSDRVVEAIKYEILANAGVHAKKRVRAAAQEEDDEE